MRPYVIFWIILIISISPTVCKEIAYVIGEENEHPVGEANLTDYRGKDIVSFTVATNPSGTSVSQKTQKPEEFFSKEIDSKINTGNQLVRDEGLRLTGRRSGAQRIDQICSIYDYMVSNWTYVSDWRGLEQFQYSNYTLNMGQEVGSSGKGDCDDFAILMASLIDSIGGTPRIVLSYGPGGGHAYTEVYLGKNDSKDINRILRWLRSEYHTNEIYCHTDKISGDIWLNLDWWRDTGGSTRPGGPFYNGTTHIPIYIREDINNTPLTPIENLLPRVLFSYTPLEPEIGEVITFDASQSSDPDGRIVNYEWSFDDGDFAQGISKSLCPHIYSEKGKFLVKLTLTDNEGDKSSNVREINVIEPRPEAVVTYSPTDPKVGDVITFDASQSKNARGGIVGYEWDFDDGYSGKRASMKHQYLDSGTYNVTLTLINDKDATNTSVINVVVSKKEELSETTSTPSINKITNATPTNDKPFNATPGSTLSFAENVTPTNDEPFNVASLDEVDLAEYVSRGRHYFDRVKIDEAIKAYDEIIRLDPQNVEVWYEKGMVLSYIGGNWDEAIKTYDEVIRLDPQNAKAWNQKGNVLSYIGKNDEAIKAYDEAIRLDPQNAKAWYGKSNVLFGQDKKKAVEAYDEVIRLDPKNANAWFYKGQSLYFAGKKDEAIDAYDEVIRLDPKNTDAWFQKGIVLSDIGKEDEAIKAFDEVIGLDPKYASAWQEKGSSLEALGRTSEADAAYAKAKELV